MAVFPAREAARIGLPDLADHIESAGVRPVQRLFEQYRDGGGD